MNPKEDSSSVSPENSDSVNPEISDKSEVIPESDDSGVPECSDESPPQEETENLKPQLKQNSYNINLITKSFLFRIRDKISVYNPIALLKIYGLNL